MRQVDANRRTPDGPNASATDPAPEVPFAIAWDCTELDKAGHAWLLTAFANQVAFRIRIADLDVQGADFTVECQLCPAGHTEFSTACSFLSDGLDGPCEHAPEWSVLPIECRRVFIRLYEHMRAIMMLVQLGSCRSRYAGEPYSSRDHFRFGAADDLANDRRRLG
jgi:hypothetical protein